ncbi:MAG: DUF1460 domain-containing protein [Muribaculaceae bacterium]|nr:DUF1460 domain-containing protein [Muribaculaceae bacterium]
MGLKVVFISVASAGGVLPMYGEGLPPAAVVPEFHCDRDTIEIRTLLGSVESGTSRQKVMAEIAGSLKDRGADKWIYTDSMASLRINVDEFTPLSFVNTILAFGKLADNPAGGWRTFSEEFKNFSCRRNENRGFGSLMWHVADWSGDNIYRGNLKELTENYQGARSMTLSLDYLTRHREEFAALSDQDVYDGVRMMEMGFRSHKIPYLPRQAAAAKEIAEDFRDGDVIALVNDRDGSDCYAVGILAIREDGPHLIHFDKRIGKVVEEEEPLKRYLNKVAKYIKGFRWFRLS